MNLYSLNRPNILWFGGGGSSSGGGSSGRTDFPEYMKTWHNLALIGPSTVYPTYSVSEAMNAAFGNSPFLGASAYNPDEPIAAMLTASEKLEDLVNLLSRGTGLDEVISKILSDEYIGDAVEAHSKEIGDILESNTIPRFEAGMRNINAVVTSSFIIGRALLEEAAAKQVAKFSAELRQQAFGELALQVAQLKLDYRYRLSALTIEANRMKIVAKKEEADSNIKIEESHALWDLEVFKYGGNLLGSIQGTAVSTGDNRWDSRPAAGSVIGGALSGAAAGAYIGGKTGAAVGGPVGAVVGAVLGAASVLIR